MTKETINIEDKNELAEKEQVITFHRLNESTFKIQDREFKILTDYREGFDGGKMDVLFNPEIFDKYDFIVGDWGFDQLRLRGFYKDERKNIREDRRISNLEEYLKEFCNFNCAYFVVQRLFTAEELEALAKQPKSRHKQNRHTNRPSNKQRTDKPQRPVDEKNTSRQTTNNKPRPTKGNVNNSSSTRTNQGNSTQQQATKKPPQTKNYRQKKNEPAKPSKKHNFKITEK